MEWMKWAAATIARLAFLGRSQECGSGVLTDACNAWENAALAALVKGVAGEDIRLILEAARKVERLPRDDGPRQMGVDDGR